MRSGWRIRCCFSSNAIAIKKIKRARPAGLTTIKRIALADIEAQSLITFGASARIVIRTSGDKYDSLAVSDGMGEVGIRAGTTDIYEVLVAQKAILKSHP